MNVNDWQIITLDETTSTNDVINDYCLQEGLYIALRSRKQTAGRGRRGRNWISDKGNLFFSLAFEYNIKQSGPLVICASLSLWQTIKKYSPTADAKIKWPNDVLLNDSKVSGMLLEKGKDNYIIIGIGVNILHSPKNDTILYKTTSLQDCGIFTEAEDFMNNYLSIFSENISKLQNDGFNDLKKLWLDNVKGLGEKIIVRQNNTKKEGIFVGIDEYACLLLKTKDEISKILAGDVFYLEDRDE